MLTIAKELSWIKHILGPKVHKWTTIQTQMFLNTLSPMLKCCHFWATLYVHSSSYHWIITESSLPHSLAEPPTNWKYCCAIFRCSFYTRSWSKCQLHCPRHETNFCQHVDYLKITGMLYKSTWYNDIKIKTM